MQLDGDRTQTTRSEYRAQTHDLLITLHFSLFNYLVSIYLSIYSLFSLLSFIISLSIQSYSFSAFVSPCVSLSSCLLFLSLCLSLTLSQTLWITVCLPVFPCVLVFHSLSLTQSLYSHNKSIYDTFIYPSMDAFTFLYFSICPSIHPPTQAFYISISSSEYDIYFLSDSLSLFLYFPIPTILLSSSFSLHSKLLQIQVF